VSGKESFEWCALAQDLPHFLGGRRVADRCRHMDNVCSVPAQDLHHALGEKAGVHHESPVSRLDQVGRRYLHGQRAAAGEEERLAPSVGLPDLAHPLERRTKSFDQARGDVSRGRAGRRRKNGGRDFHGTGDHQQGAFGLHELDRISRLRIPSSSPPIPPASSASLS
jgi:hypothetical protein